MAEFTCFDGEIVCGAVIDHDEEAGGYFFENEKGGIFLLSDSEIKEARAIE